MVLTESVVMRMVTVVAVPTLAVRVVQVFAVIIKMMIGIVVGIGQEHGGNYAITSGNCYDDEEVDAHDQHSKTLYFALGTHPTSFFVL